MRLFLTATALTLGSTAIHAQAGSAIAPPGRPRQVAERDASGQLTGDSVAAPAAQEVSVPLGAAAGLASKAEDAGKAAAIVGFQVWQRDVRLFNAFFNFAGSTTVTGSRNDYGSALLNPSIEGLSFTTTYNRVVDSLGQSRNRVADSLRRNLKHVPDSLVRKRPPLVSVFGELAVAFTTWQPDTTKPGVSGFIIVFTPGIEFSTSTMKGDGENTYQAGIDLGPTFRLLGGNLAQGSASSFRSDTTVLGDSKTFFTGLAVTGWIRLNSVQPFIRVTRFGGTEIPGFSGLQAFMGVKALSPIFRTFTK